jgi:YggT family protein
MTYLANAGQILVNFAFGALITLLVLRVLLQLVRANFYNPFCQFLYKLTNPVLMPLRRIIPAWRNVDSAGVLLAWVLSAIKLALIYALVRQPMGLLGLGVMAVADLIDFVLVLYIVVVLARSLLSFISVDRANPVVPLIYQLSEPLLRPIRRRLPPLAGLDLSPMVVMLAIVLARVLVAAPLMELGLRLAQAD